MKNLFLNRSLLVRFVSAVVFALSISMANATVVYNYTSGETTTLEHLRHEAAGSFLDITTSIPAGLEVTASITLNSLLPSNTTTRFSTNVFIGFNARIHSFDSLSGISLQEFSVDRGEGDITTDAAGNIVAWDLDFFYTPENYLDGVSSILYRTTSSLVNREITPRAVDGVTFNTFDSFGQVISPPNFYSSNIYDSLTFSEHSDGGGIGGDLHTFFSSEAGKWSSPVPIPTAFPLLATALLSLGALRRRNKVL